MNGQTRVARGVPTGGEFATNTKDENMDLPADLRHEIVEALDNGASGTHAKVLRAIDAMYEDAEFYNSPQARVKADAAARAELEHEAAVQGLLAERAANTLSIEDFRAKLSELDGLTIGLFPLRSTIAYAEVANPRNRNRMPVYFTLTHAGERPTAADAVVPMMAKAERYEQTSDIDTWRQENDYPDTEEGWASARETLREVESSAISLRRLLGEDYNLYLLAGQD